MPEKCSFTGYASCGEMTEDVRRAVHMVGYLYQLWDSVLDSRQHLSLHEQKGGQGCKPAKRCRQAGKGLFLCLDLAGASRLVYSLNQHGLCGIVCSRGHILRGYSHHIPD